MTVRCIECEEIELARVRDVRAGQTLPIPYAAMDGFPAGRSPRDLTRRKLLQWGVAGFASVYAAKELAWDQVWNAVAEAHDAPRQNALVLIYLAGGNDGLNVVMPNGYSADSTAAAQWAAYRTARPTIGRDVVAGAKIKVTPLQGAGYAPNLAFANTTVSGLDTATDTFNNDPKYGFDTLYGDGLDNSNLAVMPAVDGLNYNLSHFDNSDIWFEASYDLNNKTGWLGRWIDRNGSDSNPLQAISIDTALAKEIRTLNKPVCAISSLPMAGFKLNSSSYGGANGLDLNPMMNSLAGVSTGSGNTYLGRSRSTYGLTYSTQQQLGVAGAHDAGRRGLPEHRHALHAPADRRATAREVARHARHHDPLGRLRHAHVPAQEPGLAAAGVLARAGRLPGGPEGARDRHQRLDARVLGVRAPREGDAGLQRGRQRRRHRPWRRRPDARDGHATCAAGSPPSGRAAARGTSSRPTTSRRATSRCRRTSARST